MTLVELNDFIGWSIAIGFLGFALGMGAMYAYIKRFMPPFD